MPNDIDRHGVQRLLKLRALLVEVLPPEEYGQEHLAGAINIPLKELNRGSTAELERDRPIIVYCHDYQ